MTATFETQRAALAEVVAIPVTPFAEDGTIDRDAHRALLRRLIDGGVRTLTPNGNTGEFYALTPEERRTITELTVEEAGDRAKDAKRAASGTAYFTPMTLGQASASSASRAPASSGLRMYGTTPSSGTDSATARW